MKKLSMNSTFLIPLVLFSSHLFAKGKDRPYSERDQTSVIEASNSENFEDVNSREKRYSRSHSFHDFKNKEDFTSNSYSFRNNDDTDEMEDSDKYEYEEFCYPPTIYNKTISGIDFSQFVGCELKTRVKYDCEFNGKKDRSHSASMTCWTDPNDPKNPGEERSGQLAGYVCSDNAQCVYHFQESLASFGLRGAICDTDYDEDYSGYGSNGHYCYDSEETTKCRAQMQGTDVGPLCTSSASTMVLSLGAMVAAVNAVFRAF